MPAPIIAAVAAPLVGAIAGKVFGPKKQGAQSNTPGDLTGLRKQNIDFLTSLMGAPDAGSRNKILENFFGPLQSQQQTEASGILSGIGKDNGASVIAALQPQYQKNLALANQSGGRFGSANALMRASAANDFNVLGAGIANQAQDRRMSAAGMLGALGQQLTANRVGLLNQLLSTGQSTSLGNPVTTTPSGTQQGASLGGGIGDILTSLMPYLLKQNPALAGAAPGSGVQQNVSQTISNLKPIGVP